MKNKDIELNKGYWDEFYRKHAVDIPSQFCVYVATDIPKEQVIAEFGCGNGRDAIYLANQGFNVFAVDLSQEAVDACQQKMDQRGIKHASFRQGDLSDDNAIETTLNAARIMANQQAVVIYSRFVMHSLDKTQESSFLASLGKHLRPGDSAYFEFRSKEDAELEKIFGGHYRRYIDTDAFNEELQKNGFQTRYSHTGQGMAVYKNEDPFVSRIVAIKPEA